MNAALIAAAGITILVVFLFVAESDSLDNGHARPRTQVLNALRWALVIVLTWLLIPAAFSQPGPQRAATTLALTVLVGALILIPLRWFVRMGGREADVGAAPRQARRRQARQSTQARSWPRHALESRRRSIVSGLCGPLPRPSCAT